MKVLVITGCVFANNCGRNSFTGLDYIVGEIAETIGEHCDVVVYTMTPYPATSSLNKAKIKSYKIIDLIKYFSLKDIKNYIKIIFNGSDSIKSNLKNLRSFFVVEDIAKYCESEKFDIIHIHGATFSSYIAAYAAEKCGVPVLFTLHGLLSFGAPSISKCDKRAERILLNVIKQQNFYISTVSQGIKDTICDYFKLDVRKVRVINNAINFPLRNSRTNNINEKLDLDSKKIIICVGTVCENKNQIQLLRVFKELSDYYKKHYVILIVGEDKSQGKIKKFIMDNKLENSVILCGFMEKYELQSVYEIANYNVMLSKSEGFGISMIEAAHFGIPTLTFSDLDAIKDIYSPESMILLNDRSDETVKKGLMDMFAKSWDAHRIKETAIRFDKDIYLNYYDLYNDILINNSNRLKNNTILSGIGLK